MTYGVLTIVLGLVIFLVSKYSGPLSQDNKPLSLSYTLDIICNWTALPRFCLFFE